MHKSSDSSVSSSGSSRSEASNVSMESESSVSAPGRRMARGKKATPKGKPRRGVIGHSNFAFGVSDKPASFG